jgi:hypothetical protein
MISLPEFYFIELNASAAIRNQQAKDSKARFDLLGSKLRDNLLIEKLFLALV